MINFSHICNAINDRLVKFNSILSEQNQIPELQESVFFQLEGKCWIGENQINLGELDYPGVYFIIGETSDEKPVIYIGKASFSSSIGRRFNNHLYKTYNDNTKYFEWNSVPCKLLRAYTINLSDMKFISSALEEFMINEIKQDFTLVNGVGNY